jgi:hypothetical protein
MAFVKLGYGTELVSVCWV